MKYIDAERLKAEIERRRLSNRYIDTEGYESELIDIITSLQQEQKPAWSEEDEKKIHFLSRLIEFQVKNDEYCFSEGRFVSKKEAIKMLKSLRPSWKPSEEQMDALKEAYESYDFCDGERSALESLYNDLKKL